MWVGYSFTTVFCRCFFISNNYTSLKQLYNFLFHCRVVGRSSLERAKANVEKYYSVVGILEDLPNFFKTIEYVFPQYFTGATKRFQGEISFKYRVGMKWSVSVGSGIGL